jgi:hypothetical protein
LTAKKICIVSLEYYVIRPPESESEVALVIVSTERVQFSFCRKHLASSSTRQMVTNMRMRLRNVGRFDDAVMAAWSPRRRHRRIARSFETRRQPPSVYRFTMDTVSFCFSIKNLALSTVVLYLFHFLSIPVLLRKHQFSAQVT